MIKTDLKFFSWDYNGHLLTYLFIEFDGNFYQEEQYASTKEGKNALIRKVRASLDCVIYGLWMNDNGMDVFVIPKAQLLKNLRIEKNEPKKSPYRKALEEIADRPLKEKGIDPKKITQPVRKPFESYQDNKYV